MRIRAILTKLERRLGVAGCPLCRLRRRDTVRVAVEPLPGGTNNAVEAYPAPCLRCGDVPEQVIELTEIVVGAEARPVLCDGIPGE